MDSHSDIPQSPVPPGAAATGAPGETGPPVAPSRLPTLTQAITLYALIVFLFVAQGIVMVLRSPADMGIAASTDPVVLLLTQVLFLVAPTFLWARIFRWDIGRTFRIRAVPVRVLFYTAAASLAFIPLSQEVEAALQRVLPVPAMMEQVFRDLLTADSTGELLLTLVTVAVVPGLIEEALFRGVFLWALLRHMTPRRAIIGSALFFAVMHFNPWQFVGGLALGSIYGVIAVWTGSLVPTMLAHMVNNGIFVVLMNTLPEAAEPTTNMAARVLLDVAGALLAILCLVRIRQLGAAADRDAAPATGEPA